VTLRERKYFLQKIFSESCKCALNRYLRLGKFFNPPIYFVEKGILSNQNAQNKGLMEGVHMISIFHGGTRMAKKKAKKKATKKKATKKKAKKKAKK